MGFTRAASLGQNSQLTMTRDACSRRGGNYLARKRDSPPPAPPRRIATLSRATCPRLLNIAWLLWKVSLGGETFLKQREPYVRIFLVFSVENEREFSGMKVCAIRLFPAPFTAGRIVFLPERRETYFYTREILRVFLLTSFFTGPFFFFFLFLISRVSKALLNVRTEWIKWIS